MLRCEWKHRKCFLTLVKKNTVNYSVFGHLTLKNHGICSGFCFSPRKNTVNNSNFAVLSCFPLFFELRWSAIHGYQILRVFFSDNQYFRMFLVSMADIIGSYERSRRCENNDAVRAVAVAKRREYKLSNSQNSQSFMQYDPRNHCLKCVLHQSAFSNFAIGNVSVNSFHSSTRKLPCVPSPFLHSWPLKKTASMCPSWTLPSALV